MSNWDIIFSPLIPPFYLWALAGFIAVIAGMLLFKRMPGAILRTAGLALLLLALFNPSLAREDRESLSNILLVMVDKSPSQIISKRDDLVERAKKALDEQLATLPELEVEVVSLNAEDEGAADGTMAFAKLRDALARVPANRIAGVVMITDGQIHDAPKTFSDLGIEAPIHTILTGDKGEFDRRIEIVKAPRYGIVGSSRSVILKIVEQGKTNKAKRPLKLSIRQKGEAEAQRFVEVGEEVELALQFPHAGVNLMEIEVESEDGEITTANNRTVISAEGVRENLRVLLVSGEPHAGERTWRNLLKSDASVDLVHFTILRPPEKQDGTPIHQLSLIAFPTRELFSEKLSDFDLIIFDRYQRRGVLPMHYLDNVSQYVLNGGAVLIAAGDKFSGPVSLANTPLEQILPAFPTGQVIEKPYRPEVTEKGSRHPVTHNLPNANGLSDKTPPGWGRWFRLMKARINEGETLMTGAEKQPLLVLNRLGEGRIALLLSDHAWLWARSFDGGGPYKVLLRRLSHWLMKEPDLEEESLQAIGDGRKLKVTRRSMQEKIEPLTHTLPDGTNEQIELEETSPGVWETVLDQQDLGIHRVKSDKMNALAFIGFANAREMENIVTTDKTLAPLAEKAKSGLFWTGKPADNEEVVVPKVSLTARASGLAGDDWMAFKDRQAYLVKNVELIPLFTGFLALGLFLIALGSMWWREGH